MLIKRIVLLTLPVLLTGALFAQKPKGHNLKFKLDNYTEKSLVLGFYYGEKQFVKDTAEVDASGIFTFAADTLLPCGVYILVLLPENTFIQFLVPEDDQDFTMHADNKDAVQSMKVKGSEDNAIFYDYLRYINEQRVLADTLRKQQAGSSPADSVRLNSKLAEVDQSVKKYQQDLLKKHPNTLAAKMVRSAIEPDIPEFQGSEEDVRKLQYYWYRAHFFDNLSLSDPCLLRSPVMFPKVDAYVNKVVPQHPDSINVAIDSLLRDMSPSPELYKYYLIHFLNYFAKSNIVGMDAVYVHIAQEYYCKGNANWAQKEDVEKICDNAVRLAPILIGKTAPNITVLDKNNQPHNLWDVDADYTVLFFWDPECSHCKKAAPSMVSFAEQYKDRGVKVFAVCTAVGEKGNDCWKSLEEKGFTDFLFLNYYDPYMKSRYKQLYDVRSTPQIFILDRKHEILIKRIGAEQLPQVMEEVMKFQAEKKSKGK
ncbi:MAG: redoxin domain-containing protein [Saprospiraceae bacterium]|nr:redoxin domain-containing protein [Saprospiraceae bacterium]